MNGLEGFFGHTLEEPGDVDKGGPHLIRGKAIGKQFQVLRPMDGSRWRRWVVQLFSYWDGAPSKVEVMDEATLLDDERVQLYPTAAEMQDAYSRFANEWTRWQESQGGRT